MSPELEEVIAFVRDYTGWKSKVINEATRLENDLGITGMDGVDFLQDAEKFFDVSFETEDENIRTLFDLKENEYLFSSEGFDLLGICYFLEWLRGEPHPVVKDLSVGQLHRALVKLRGKNPRDVHRDV